MGWPREPAYQVPAQHVAEIEPEIVNAFQRLIRLPVVTDGAFVPRDIPMAEAAWGGFLHFLQFLHDGKAGLDGREREYWCKGSAHVLRLAARDHAASVHTGVRVTAIARAAGGRVVGVETSAGRVATETVVNAAGTWAGEVAGLAGVRLAIEPRRVTSPRIS